ncbi:MAG: alpha-1,4-glucan--maltose-1-phosphate maltosyltransferase [Acidimicrobiia bacterium]
MLPRIQIQNVRPRTTTGAFPAKGVEGLPVRVRAEIFRDGHDLLGARVLWRPVGGSWTAAPLTERGNDEWEGSFVPAGLGLHEFVVEAWTDRAATLRRDIAAKQAAGDDVSAERAELAACAGRPFEDLTRSPVFQLWVDRRRAQVGAWYELFPRSEGGLAGTIEALPRIAAMGFDVLYLPPIHPIGTTARKGRDGALVAAPGDPGSPWAIGSPEGGHTAVHPELGTIDDFDRLVETASAYGIEIALDYALQCSPDHPWVRDHPEWFRRRPDGSIRYAENPPKKYQDIYPLELWPPDEADRRAVWEAAREVLEFWIGHGVRIFRVDNPHTKPLPFWAWLIASVRAAHPEVVFLSEAFTRPKMMAKLAEVGFSQSYTYFTWRTGRDELRDYVVELTQGPTADFMRPNFWPNTPDILAGPLRNGPPAAFALRLVLAALLVPSYGIYSGYELCENEPASEENEEYLHSEKYEIRRRNWNRPGPDLVPLITRINEIRRRHRCFDELDNLRFHHANHPNLLVWSKQSADGHDIMLMVVNTDPHTVAEDILWIDLGALGLPWDAPLEARDELNDAVYHWRGPSPYVRLDPAVTPAHVVSLRPLEVAS